MNKLSIIKSLQKGSFVFARILSEKKPLAAFKHHKIEKLVLCTVRTGIDYSAQKAVTLKRESGELPSEPQALPWGMWTDYPYAIEHKGASYLRLYLGQSMKIVYFVDGKRVKASDVKAMLPKESRSGKPDCITVKEASLIGLRVKGKELIK